MCEISPSSGLGHAEFCAWTTRPEDIKWGFIGIIPGSDVANDGGAMFATQIHGDNFPIPRIGKGLMK